jgi:tetratricopeptide (TPR) repeat protein
MVSTSIKIAFFIIVFFGCSTIQNNYKDDSITYNALGVMKDLHQKLDYLIKDFDQNRFKKMIDWSDYICSKGIKDTNSYNFQYLLNEIENLNSIGELCDSLFNITKDYYFELVITELRFRTLVGMQQNLYKNYHQLPVKQKFSSSIIFATTNSEISEIKTNLLYSQFGIIYLLDDRKSKLRLWLALKRMLNEIDIQQSESGNQIIQRSPYGIITDKGFVFCKLKNMMNNEIDKEVKEFAQKTIEYIKSNDSKYKEDEDQIVISDINNLINTKSINENAIIFFNKAFNAVDNDQKIYLYSKAIDYDSNFTAAFNNRGICYFENNNYELAINDFKIVLKTDSSNAIVYNYIGNIYLKLEDYHLAIDYYSISLKLSLDNISVLINRGLCYYKMGEYMLAISDFTAAININPNSIIAYKNRTQSYQAVKNDDDAISDYKILILLEPNNSTNYYNLGCIYWRKKDWLNVIDIWRRGLSINPNDDNIKSNLPKAEKELRK